MAPYFNHSAYEIGGLYSLKTEHPAGHKDPTSKLWASVILEEEAKK